MTHRNFEPGSFRDTERTSVIGEQLCEHTFEIRTCKYPFDQMPSNLTELLMKVFKVEHITRFVTIRVTSQSTLNPAIIEHFKRWKHCSLSLSEREELGWIFLIVVNHKSFKGKATLQDMQIEIECRTKFKFFFKNRYFAIRQPLFSHSRKLQTENELQGLVEFYSANLAKFYA